MSNTVANRHYGYDLHHSQCPPNCQQHGPLPKQALAHSIEAKYLAFGGALGGSKMQPLDATVWTPFGPKRMGDIQVGDQISNPEGGVSRVIAVTPHPRQPIYRLTFEDGATCEAGLEHLWQVRQVGYTRFRKLAKDDRTTAWRVATTAQIIGQLKAGKKLVVPVTEPVTLTLTSRFPKGRWPIPPYTLGVLLGDGCLANPVKVTSADPEIIAGIEADGIKVSRPVGKKGNTSYDYVLPASVRKSLIGLGLGGKHSWEKFIPARYHLAPIEMRAALMKGLMDTDGYADKRGHCSYTTVSEQLSKDIQRLAWSLGYKANITTQIPTFTHNGEKRQGRLAYTVWIKGSNGKELFALERKRERATAPYRIGRHGNGERVRQIASIEYSRDAEAQCIAVDHPNGLYLTDDFVVTHNSAWLANEIIGNGLEYPGTRMLLARQSASSLLKTTLIELFKWMPPGSYHWSPGYRTVLFKETGSILDYVGLEHWQSIQSTEYQSLYIDQCEEVEFQGFQTADWRLRITDRTRLANIAAAGLTPEQVGYRPGELVNPLSGDTHPPYYVRLSFNPNPHHWLKEFFYDDAEVIEVNGIPVFVKGDDRVFIQSFARDNPHLPHDYVESRAATSTPQWWKANVLGEWVSLEDEALPEFDPHLHVVDIDHIEAEYPKLRAIDHGQSKSSGTACLWGAIYPNGTPQPTLVVYGEYLVFNQPPVVHVNAIKEQSEGETYFTTRVDPTVCRSDKTEIFNTYRAGGIQLAPANNDMDTSIAVLRAMMKYDPNVRNPFTGEMGAPRFFIVQHKDERGRIVYGCPLLPQKIVAAAYKKYRDGTETKELRPRDGDMMDALRYLAMAVGIRRTRPTWGWRVAGSKSR